MSQCIQVGQNEYLCHIGSIRACLPLQSLDDKSEKQASPAPQSSFVSQMRSQVSFASVNEDPQILYEGLVPGDGAGAGLGLKTPFPLD